MRIIDGIDEDKIMDPEQAKHMIITRVNNILKSACIEIKAKRYK